MYFGEITTNGGMHKAVGNGVVYGWNDRGRMASKVEMEAETLEEGS